MIADDALFKRIPEHLTVSADPPEDSSRHKEFEEAQQLKKHEFSNACHAMLNKQRSFFLRFELEFDLIPQVIP